MTEIEKLRAERDRFAAALRMIVEGAPAEQPEEEDYDDTESAYGNGLDVARWECGELAREALADTASPAPDVAAMATALRKIVGLQADYDRDVSPHDLLPDAIRWASTALDGWRRGAASDLLPALRNAAAMLENYAAQAGAADEPCVKRALAAARLAIAKAEGQAV